jgi:hypothetical protein
VLSADSSDITTLPPSLEGLNSKVAPEERLEPTTLRLTVAREPSSGVQEVSAGSLQYGLDPSSDGK